MQYYYFAFLPSPSAEIKEILELYFRTPSGSSWFFFEHLLPLLRRLYKILNPVEITDT
jgi:hypothetical protein